MSHSQRTKTPMYNIWSMMKQRCGNPRAANYTLYGGRGIMVCARWKSYDLFLLDLGHPPEGMTLDRIDPEGDYTPENCRWATISEQNNNKRNCVFIEFKGERRTVAQWAKQLGVRRDIIEHRIKAGYPLDKVLTSALTPHRRKIQAVAIETGHTQIFCSLAEAGRSVAEDQRAIWAALRTKTQTKYGKRWSYVE